MISCDKRIFTAADAFTGNHHNSPGQFTPHGIAGSAVTPQSPTGISATPSAQRSTHQRLAVWLGADRVGRPCTTEPKIDKGRWGRPRRPHAWLRCGYRQNCARQDAGRPPIRPRWGCGLRGAPAKWCAGPPPWRHLARPPHPTGTGSRWPAGQWRRR